MRDGRRAGQRITRANAVDIHKGPRREWKCTQATSEGLGGQRGT